MEKTTLQQIAEHFTQLYAEEIAANEVNDDCIHEWWTMTCDQYGYSQEDKDEVLEEVQREIWSKMVTDIIYK